MSCCGNKRAAWSAAQAPASTPPAPALPHQQAVAAPKPVAIPQQKEKMWPDLRFEHLGAGTLTLIGSMTGRHYHWPGKGSVQAIDYRDASGMTDHAMLRRVR